MYVSHLLVYGIMAHYGAIFLAMTFASCAAYFKTFTNFLQKTMPESFFLMRKSQQFMKAEKVNKQQAPSSISETILGVTFTGYIIRSSRIQYLGPSQCPFSVASEAPMNFSKSISCKSRHFLRQRWPGPQPQSLKKPHSRRISQAK